MKRFVILAAPRTGSNLLCTLLHSHPDVLCHHEIFNPEDIFVAQPLRDTSFSLGCISERNLNPLDFLQQVWKNDLGHKQVGFKMTHYQQREVFNAVCADTEVHKIVLRRKQTLKTYVSQLIAQQTGIWEDYRKNTTREKPKPVEVNYQQLKAAINFNLVFYHDLNLRIRGSKTELYYEDLFERNTQKHLLNNLGLKVRPLTATSQQQNPYTVRELISNLKPLTQQLMKTSSDSRLLAELNANFSTQK